MESNSFYCNTYYMPKFCQEVSFVSPLIILILSKTYEGNDIIPYLIEEKNNV